MSTKVMIIDLYITDDNDNLISTNTACTFQNYKGSENLSLRVLGKDIKIPFKQIQGMIDEARKEPEKF